jgi:hypothetical protein
MSHANHQRPNWNPLDQDRTERSGQDAADDKTGSVGDLSPADRKNKGDRDRECDQEFRSGPATSMA